MPRLAPGLLLAFLAGALAAPSEARASSCGHYVLSGGKDGRAMPAHPLGHLPVSPADHKPCHGPTCSAAPLSASPVSAPPAPVRGEQWGCLPGWSADTASGPNASIPDLVLPPAAGRGAAVYRPPR